MAKPTARRRPLKMAYRAIADYYDAENAQHRVLEEDLPFFLGQLPRERQSILELGVGTGRAAIPLAQAGHRVVGVDYARDMITLAARKRDAIGLSESALRLIRTDVTSMKLGQRFDWVCVFFNTFLIFSTLKQQDAALQSAVRHLKRDGRFYLDIFQPDWRLLAEAHHPALEPSIFFVPSLDRTVQKSTEIRRGKEPQIQHVTFHYRWFGPLGQEHHERTEFDMTWMTARELRLLLERNGLQIEEMWGNYDGSALDAESPRMIVRCCRR